MTLAEGSQYLNYAECVVAAALVIYLGRLGLLKRYRFFILLLCWKIFSSAVLHFAPFTRTQYGYVYFGNEAVLWVVSSLVVLELYGLVLKNHPAIAKFSRRALIVALAAAIALALISLNVGVETTPKTYQLDLLFVLARVIMLSLVIFIIMMTIFLQWFPVPVSSNVSLHCALLAGYFASRTMVFLARNLFGVGITPYLNLLAAVLPLACLSGWFFFTKAGEETMQRRPSNLSDREREQLLLTLENLNDTLSGSLKRTK